MQSSPSHTNAPIPDLRIIMTETIHPHEYHDRQRSEPLIEKLRSAKVLTNPPIVAQMGASQYVILDGANRWHSFSHLEYPHLLVQVVSYDSGYVELDTWNHVVSGWNSDELIQTLQDLPEVELKKGQDVHAIAHVILPDGQICAIHAPVDSAHERNAALNQVVKVYQQNATLNRTALEEPQDVWPLFPNADALVVFPRYRPADIIAAAKYKAYLPSGISRHIVHGRALRVNYPLDVLCDTTIGLAEKNEALTTWIQQKLGERQIRYYAEAVYQFDE
jgi:hypothetical protein